jgi:hypothetical protein
VLVCSGLGVAIGYLIGMLSTYVLHWSGLPANALRFEVLYAVVFGLAFGLFALQTVLGES